MGKTIETSEAVIAITDIADPVWYVRSQLDASHLADMIEFAREQIGADGKGDWPFPMIEVVKNPQPERDKDGHFPAEYRLYTILDGFHRREVARKLKFTNIEALVHDNLDEKSRAMRQVESNAFHGLPLTREQRNEAVKLLVKSGWKQREVAAKLGMDESSISRIVKEKPKAKPEPTPAPREFDALAWIKSLKTTALKPKQDDMQSVMTLFYDEEHFNEFTAKVRPIVDFIDELLASKEPKE